MIYFASDTHFGHFNIIRYCERPFANVEEMNRQLINNWNSVVKFDDTVYHLGDFAMGPKELWGNYRAALNGRIVFVCGNHDEPRERWRREVLSPGDEEHDVLRLKTKYGEIYMKHEPPSYNRDMSTLFLRMCGHVHTQFKKIDNVVNVGVDVWGYKPITLE